VGCFALEGKKEERKGGRNRARLCKGIHIRRIAPLPRFALMLLLAALCLRAGAFFEPWEEGGSGTVSFRAARKS